MKKSLLCKTIKKNFKKTLTKNYFRKLGLALLTTSFLACGGSWNTSNSDGSNNSNQICKSRQDCDDFHDLLDLNESINLTSCHYIELIDVWKVHGETTVDHATFNLYRENSSEPLHIFELQEHGESVLLLIPTKDNSETEYGVRLGEIFYGLGPNSNIDGSTVMVIVNSPTDCE